MAEYIKREPKCEECIHHDVCYLEEVSVDIVRVLKDFGCDDFKPTADVVEVVRCKDCEYFKENYCQSKFGLNGFVSGVDYCSNGQKMDGKGEA